ncbi:sulfatase [Elusimicrobiota bacterium]
MAIDIAGNKAVGFRPNVIMIVIDALRARNLGCYGGEPGISPWIDNIARQGLLFSKAYCTWNTTDPSLTTILTGKYPISHGITQHGDKVNERHLDCLRLTGTRTIGQILKEHNYHTITVDWMKRWFKLGIDDYGYIQDQGFVKKARQYLKYMANHREIFSLYMSKRAGFLPSLSDIKGTLGTFLFTRELAELQDAAFVTASAIKMIKRRKKSNFFALIHYWDTHTPYNSPKSFTREAPSGKKEALKGKYLGAVRYTDSQVGKLCDALKADGLLDNTLLIITSDHGESLTEHDIYFDHHGLYEESIHVPLIMRYPRLFPDGKKIDAFVQHVDLLPMILDILGIDAHEHDLDGRNLMPLVDGTRRKIRPFVYSEESYVQRKMAIRTDRYKFIYPTDGMGHCRYCRKIHSAPVELYDLSDDPRETRNIAQENDGTSKALGEQLQDFVSGLIIKRNARAAAGRNPGNVRETDCEAEEAEISRKLRSLGYHG